MSGPTATIQLNGEPYAIEAGQSVGRLLETLNLRPNRVAVELNRQIVPRASYTQTALSAGDIVEVINFVGGG